MNTDMLKSKLFDSEGYVVNKLTAGLEEVMDQNDLVFIDTCALYFGLSSCFTREEREPLKRGNKKNIRRAPLPKIIMQQSIDYNNFLTMMFRAGHKLRVLPLTIDEYPVAQEYHFYCFGSHYRRHGLEREYVFSVDCLKESLFRGIQPKDDRTLPMKMNRKLEFGNISSTDKGYLVTSLARTQRRGDTALVTNDWGMIYVARNLNRLMKKDPNMFETHFIWSVHTMINSPSLREVVKHKPPK